MKTIQMSLETARKLYKSCDDNTKTWLLENFTKKELEEKVLPRSWEELNFIEGAYISSTSDVIVLGSKRHTESSYKNVWPTKELAEAALALSQLCQLRDVYNDGWVPDYTTADLKHCIYTHKNVISADFTYYTNKTLCFKTKELRIIFLDNFKDLLEIAKPLL